MPAQGFGASQQSLLTPFLQADKRIIPCQAKRGNPLLSSEE